MLLAHPASGQAPPFVAGDARFGAKRAPEWSGALLITELSCAACHAAEGAEWAPKRGPRLDGLGQRARREWLLAFLEAPGVTKPGTTMPDVLARLPKEQRKIAARSLAAFLLNFHQSPYPPLAITKDEDPAASSAHRGRELYHQVGCVACHDPDPPHGFPVATAIAVGSEEDEEGRVRPRLELTEQVESVPLGPLRSKYTHDGLTRFLLDPAVLRPGGRMPNLRLGIVEAADIAHYLLGEKQAADDVESTASDVEAGRRWFGELGCANCHAVGESPAALAAARPLRELASHGVAGCLAERPPENQPTPRYPLDDRQRRSLAAALRSLADVAPAPGGENDKSMSVARAADRVDATLARLNCYACHSRGREQGEQGSVGGVGQRRWDYFRTVNDIDLGDEGRIPPTLAGVGRKLTNAALERVLKGEGNVRPYLLARMPVFPWDHVRKLAADLPVADEAAADGVSAPAPEQVPPTMLVEAGRELLSYGCVQCHPLRGTPLPGVLGIDLASSAERLRPAWFAEFLRDPGAVRPRTRMPNFFPGGRSSVPQVLEGAPPRQIDAIWGYLLTPTAELPDRLLEHARMDFELRPTERPIVQRTFMRAAGTHAVAVGFPAGVHYAYDSRTLRLAEAWRGRFLDAHGTWFDRFAPPAEPLGVDRVAFPSGPSLAILQEGAGMAWPGANDALLLGLELADDGTPTIEYSLGGWIVAETIRPMSDGRGLQRTLVGASASLDASPSSDLWLRLLEGEQIEASTATAPPTYASAALRVTLPSSAATPRKTAHDLRIPVVSAPAPPKTGWRLEVLYAW